PELDLGHVGAQPGARGVDRAPAALRRTPTTKRAVAMLMATRRNPNEKLAPPSLALLALEFRAPWEFGAVLPAWPALLRAPAGDGHSVIVFPGLSASDAST